MCIRDSLGGVWLRIRIGATPCCSLEPEPRRHWVIGDVHGCHQPLCHLLATLPPNDHLVFCGDVINRGEAIPATMNLVWDLVQAGRATWLRGNHEQDLIDALESQDGLSQLATHAWFDAAGQPDLSIRDPFWEAYDGRFGQFVVGHTPRPQVARLGAIVLIDTGAVYGGCLSAYCPETDAVVQVEGVVTDAVLAGVGPC